MKVLAEVTIIPIGVGTSLSSYVAACTEIFDRHGLHQELHANGTNLEGDWDAVNAALQECHRHIHDMGAPRISTSLKIATRVDRDQSLSDKVASVRAALDE